MAERSSRFPYGEYPFMFGTAELPSGFDKLHAANFAFAQNVIVPPDPYYKPTELDRLATLTCATALTSTDHRLGRNTAGLGTMATEDEDGFWQYFAMPTFYHNGDGTRQAMLGTQTYMNYIDHIEGAASPYRNRDTRIATMLAAAYDDLVFGRDGRGGDELQSAGLARLHMLLQGFAPDMIDVVTIGIEASIFNEASGTQNYDPSKGAEPVQRGSLVGDIWQIGTSKGPLNTFLLMVENLWKRDLANVHGQILRNKALHQAVHIWNWQQPRTFIDFLRFAQTEPEVVAAFGDALINNRDFLLNPNRFVDPRITALMRAGLQQNATLQHMLGNAIKRGYVTITEAFQCVVSYADGHKWVQGQRPTASLGDYSPAKISQLLLCEHSIETITKPVDAVKFYYAFMAERRR